ncbi:MAG: efflux RND transporter periplasmic adaptor subunit [Methylophagaceae bacterium]
MKINKNILIVVVTLMMSMPISATEYTDIDCLIKPEMYIDVSSPVEGVVSALLVNKNDSVEAGQVLAQLEDSIEVARVEIATHEAAMANQIQTKKVRLDYALRKEERVAKLRDSALSEQEYDDAVTEVALAKKELLQIRLDQKKNQLNLVLAKAELLQKTIKSPVNGIVVERYLLPGEATNKQPILQIAKVDPLLVEVVAPYELFGLIEQGMEVEIWPDLPRDSQYKAQVSIVDRIIDAASGSFSIQLALPNSDDTLIGGTKCMARFPVAQPEQQLPDSISSSEDTSADMEELPDDIKALLSSE